MMCGGGLLRTATCESAVVIAKTSATSSMIGGISEPGHQPLHDILQQEMSHHQREGGFRALAPSLRQVVWLDKFKAGHIDRYDGSNNSEKFIQVYHTIIEAAGGDDRVKANYMPTSLSGAARTWLINLPEGSIYTWD
jgi:hypothetical protein